MHAAQVALVHVPKLLPLLVSCPNVNSKSMRLLVFSGRAACFHELQRASIPERAVAVLHCSADAKLRLDSGVGHGKAYHANSVNAT